MESMCSVWPPPPPEWVMYTVELQEGRVADVEWLSASEWEEPQQLPARATDFSQSPLPGPLCTKSAKRRKDETFQNIHIQTDF